MVRTEGLAVALAALTLLAPFGAFAQFRETGQLTSNNVKALAGSGDTLWLATERGLNYRTSLHTQEGWPGFEDKSFGNRFFGLAFGGGGAAALVYGERQNLMGFWYFNHASGESQEAFFRFPNSVICAECADLANVAPAAPTGHVVYARGSFWASFNRGGIVRYNPADNSFSALRPRDTVEVRPEDVTPVDASDSARIVTALGVTADGNTLLIVTPDTSWTYDIENKIWAEKDTILPDSIYRAIDSDIKSGRLLPMLEINDRLFMPRGNDSTGTLVFATTTGLYVCESARPLAGEYGEFVQIKYVREVKAGDAYALPGIIRGGYDGRYAKAVFVYKLKKDGKVTINVYDYRMSLVKTVVKGKERSSKSLRSTDPARDFWDGTNRSGRTVSPGVYYFKITSSGGERFFGKVILAK